MKLSVFCELPVADPEDPHAEAKVFDEALEQIEYADQLGYFRVWQTEHHFLPGYSHSSAPETFLAAVSQRTKRIRIGHGIVQCPHNINNPIRIAERVATLDILSHGRVDFGAGRGTIPMEMEAFGVDPEGTREELIETLRMLPGMWMSNSFSWNGEGAGSLTIPPRQIVPKPIQKPHPPMWVAATQPWTVQFAAENGLGLLGFGIRDQDKDDLLRLYREKIEHATPIGAFVNNQFAVMRVAMCCPTDDEALELQGANFRLFYEQLKAVNSTWRYSDAPRTYEYASERAKRALLEPPVSFKETVDAGGAIIGSPASCLRALKGLEATGVDEVILFMQCGTAPHDWVMESLRLFGEQVMPQLN